MKKQIIFMGIVIAVLCVGLFGFFVYRAAGDSKPYVVSYPEVLSSPYYAWAAGRPDVVINPKGSPKIDDKGCYTGNTGDLKYMDNSPEKFTFVKIHSMLFCLTRDGDLAGGKNHEGFYYTVYRAGNYFTVEYMLEETVCRNNPADPDSVTCLAAQSPENYDKILVTPIQASAATFRFTHSALIMNVVRLFSAVDKWHLLTGK